MTDKKDFLKNKLAPMFLQLAPEQPGRWGKMKAQQMVEHLSEYVRIASGKQKVSPLNSEEVTAKMQAFMMSEKPFRENTPNPLLPDVPAPAKQPSMAEAVRELQQEIDDFFDIYENSPALKNVSPFFGILGFEEQVHLLHKHGMHHARQFGLIE